MCILGVHSLQTMAFRSIWIFLAVTLARNSAQNARTRIVIPPNPVNISENSEAFLNCTIIGHHINWKVNNEPISDFPHPGFKEKSMLINATTNMQFGQLRITGSKENNGTTVTCVASQLISDSRFTIAESKPVLILVQGLLDAVTNLKIEASDTRATLTWDAPNSLAEVPILYNIRLDTCSTTNILRFENTTLHYSYELPHRVHHTVTVNAENNAGIGPESVASIILPNFMVQIIQVLTTTTFEFTTTIMATKTSFFQSATTRPISSTEFEMPANFISLSIIGFILLVLFSVFALSVIMMFYKNRNLQQKIDELESERLMVQKGNLKDQVSSGPL